MSIPNYLYALANHTGPAKIIPGGMTIPVKIMNLEHESSPYETDKCTFECMVVNQDKIRPARKSVASDAMMDILGTSYDANPMGRSVAAPVRAPYRNVIEDVEFGKTSSTVTWVVGPNTSIVCPYGNPYSEEDCLALHFTLRHLGITKVVFKNPLTLVIWENGAETRVSCQEGDAYSEISGLMLCIAKKDMGNKGNFNNVFKKWIPEEEKPETEAPAETEVTPEEEKPDAE